jgi:hypothetical protein
MMPSTKSLKANSKKKNQQTRPQSRRKRLYSFDESNSDDTFSPDSDATMSRSPTSPSTFTSAAHASNKSPVRDHSSRSISTNSDNREIRRSLKRPFKPGDDSDDNEDEEKEDDHNNKENKKVENGAAAKKKGRKPASKKIRREELFPPSVHAIIAEICDLTENIRAVNLKMPGGGKREHLLDPSQEFRFQEWRKVESAPIPNVLRDLLHTKWAHGTIVNSDSVAFANVLCHYGLSDGRIEHLLDTRTSSQRWSRPGGPDVDDSLYRRALELTVHLGKVRVGNMFKNYLKKAH